eukprot:COSAG01_NODE_8350_length_2820_cov_1.780595_4_plen_83_part_00
MMAPPPPKTTVAGTPTRGQERPQEAAEQQVQAQQAEQAEEEMLRLTVPEVLECLHVRQENKLAPPCAHAYDMHAPPRPARPP